MIRPWGCVDSPGNVKKRENKPALAGCLVQYWHQDWGIFYWGTGKRVKLAYLSPCPVWPVVFHREASRNDSRWVKEMGWGREAAEKHLLSAMGLGTESDGYIKIYCIVIYIKCEIWFSEYIYGKQVGQN